MRQAVLKIKNYGSGIRIVDNGDLLRSIFRMLVCLAILMAVSYALLLGDIVKNTVERKVLEKRANLLVPEVGRLELIYLSKSKAVDMQMAHSLGFREKPHSYFVESKRYGLIEMGKNEL